MKTGTGINRIAVAGNLLVDHLRTIEELPARSELVRVQSISNAVGGCVCNVGADLAVLDPSLEVQAYGCIGEDADGEFILEHLRGHGIKTDGIIRRGSTSFTDVFTEKKHHCRTFFTYGGAGDEFSPEDISPADLDCGLFHIGYLLLLKQFDSPDDVYGTRMARFLDSVRRRGIVTSIDIVSENSDRFGRVVRPVLPYVDLLCINEVEAGNTVGVNVRLPNGALSHAAVKEVLLQLRALGVHRWVIIHAKEGAFAIDENGALLFEASKPLPHGYIAGTTGAGDAFCAGVLLAFSKNVPLGEALVWGNAAAQVSLRSESATGGLLPISAALEIYQNT